MTKLPIRNPRYKILFSLYLQASGNNSVKLIFDIIPAIKEKHIPIKKEFTILLKNK